MGEPEQTEKETRAAARAARAEKQEARAEARAARKIRKGGGKAKLKFGQDLNYPPYAFGENGQPTGFGHDIALGVNQVCDHLEIEVVATAWSNCWQAHGLGALLANGTLDACMTYTHTKGIRNEFADFSYGI